MAASYVRRRFYSSTLFTAPFRAALLDVGLFSSSAPTPCLRALTRHSPHSSWAPSASHFRSPGCPAPWSDLSARPDPWATTKALTRPFSTEPKAETSKVVPVTSSKQFQETIQGAPPGRLVVVDFTAAWCRPCQMIAPKLDELSLSKPDVTFLKVDIDDSQLFEVVDAARVLAVPLFQFYKGGKVVSSFEGADVNKLQDTIKIFEGP